MFVQAHDVKTHYQTLGQGPIVVLLHGWGCDWQIWYPVIQELSQSFQLIIPDLPAFGQSAIPTQVWSSDEYGQWLQEFLQAVTHRQPFTLVGHSFGGKLAANYASQQLEPQPAHLILVDAAGLPDELSAQHQLQQRLLGLIPESFKKLIPHQLKTKALNQLQASTDHLNSTPAQRLILRQTIRENLLDELPHITVPTLIMWGEHDTDTPLAKGQQFAAQIPGANLVVYPTGHFPFIDQPQPFMTDLKSFILKS